MTLPYPQYEIERQIDGEWVEIVVEPSYSVAQFRDPGYPTQIAVEVSSIAKGEGGRVYTLNKREIVGIREMIADHESEAEHERTGR